MSFPTTRHTLIARACSGDDGACASFVLDYTAPAFDFMGNQLGLGEEEAKNLWQEVVTKLKRGSFRKYSKDKGTFRSWLITVLRNKLRDQKRHGTAAKRDEHATFSGDAPVSPEEPEGETLFARLEDKTDLHYANTRKAVQESLDHLLKDYPDATAKRAFLRQFWNDEGLTHEEIASQCGLTYPQFRTRLIKLKAHLRRRWNQEPGL